MKENELKQEMRQGDQKASAANRADGEKPSPPVLHEGLPEKKDLNYYAENILNQWNDITGYFTKNTSYYYEIISVLEDVVSMVSKKFLLHIKQRDDTILRKVKLLVECQDEMKRKDDEIERLKRIINNEEMRSFTKDEVLLIKKQREIDRLKGSLEIQHDVNSKYSEKISELQSQLDEANKKIKQIHEDYGCEVRDPNGTIWDYAKSLEKKLEGIKEMASKEELAIVSQAYCKQRNEDKVLDPDLLEDVIDIVHNHILGEEE